MSNNTLKPNKVKILIGSHGSGKSEWIYNKLINLSRNIDNKIDLDKRIVLIVPEQDTNEKQKLIMNKLNEFGYGILNFDVVSFDRLAHNIFDRLNISPKNENIIDDSGKTMILTKVIIDLNKEGKLKYYAKMSNNIGFAKKMTQAMSEFYSYGLISESENGKTIDKIDQVIQKLKNSNDLLKSKLSDLREIYISFIKKLKDLNYSIKETKLDLLNKYIYNDKSYFENAIIVFEGFTGFTPIQLDIFSKIADLSKETYIVIDYRKNNNDNLEFNNNIELTDVFYLSKTFVKNINKKLKSIGFENNSEIINYNEKDIIYKYLDKEDMSFLENNIYNYNKNFKPKNITPTNIFIYETKNSDDEIINAAHIILNEIKNDKTLKFNDIKIIVPNLEEYSDKILNIFKSYNIPIFIDSSKSILNSPYIEAIRSAFDVVLYNFSYDSIMRYINSGIFNKNDDINDIDNFIRKYGIRGVNRYKSGFEGIFDFNISSLINKLNNETIDNKKNKIKNEINYYNNKKNTIINTKNQLFNPLIDLYYDIKANKNSLTVNKYLEIIDKFIKNSELDKKFDELISDLKNKDLSLEYKENNNYVNKFKSNYQIDVLNKSIEVKNKTFETMRAVFKNSDDTLTIQEFKNIFDIGFTDIEIKILPHSIDQVVVGDLMRSRFNNPRIQICLGFNQSKVPSPTNDNTLIDDNIRDEFKKHNIEMSQTTYETALNQRFYLYLILTNPKDKLIISYPRLNINKSSDEKSSIITQIENLFGYYETIDNRNVFITNVIINKLDKYSLGFFSDFDLYDFIAENMQSLRREYDNNSFNIDNNPIKKAIIYLYEKYKDDFIQKFNTIFNQVSYSGDKTIDKDIIKKIIDKERGGNVASASYIETYNSCPYKHFLERTINLKKRDNYEISSTDLGSYLHRILELYYKNYSKSELNINNINIMERIDYCINAATNDNLIFRDLKLDDELYYGNNKLNAIKRLSRRLIQTSIRTIDYLINGSTFTEFFTEVSFENSISVDELNSIKVNGKVDKIESYKIDNNTYVNIIDYKSGKNAKTISIKEIEEGTNIQLVLYLDYCINNLYKNKNIIPCGSFYFWIEDPIIQLKSINELQSVKDKIYEKLSYVGIANDNVEIIKNINNNLLESRNIYVDKDSGFTIKGEKFKIDNNGNEKSIDINNLINITRNVVNTSINKIEEGNIEAKTNDNNNCSYCPFANICMKEKVFYDEESDLNS